MGEQIHFVVTECGQIDTFTILSTINVQLTVTIIEDEPLQLCLLRCISTTFDDLIGESANVSEHARIIGCSKSSDRIPTIGRKESSTH